MSDLNGTDIKITITIRSKEKLDEMLVLLYFRSLKSNLNVSLKLLTDINIIGSISDHANSKGDMNNKAAGKEKKYIYTDSRSSISSKRYTTECHVRATPTLTCYS